MIHKFWNIKLAPSPPVPKPPSEPDVVIPGDFAPDAAASQQEAGSPSEEWEHQESTETAQSLKDKQKLMEEQVYRIWTVLSTFEESSAACISEMLRHVSNGQYLEGVRMAEKFVLHVETLFAAIDDLGAFFRQKNAKGGLIGGLVSRSLMAFLQRFLTSARPECFARRSLTSSPSYRTPMKPGRGR